MSEHALTAIELIHALSNDPDNASRVVRVWANDVDCVVTGVRFYQGPDGMRLDLSVVNRKQVEL